MVNGELVFLEAGTRGQDGVPSRLPCSTGWPGEISCRRGVLGGKPGIAGTRISAATVLRLVAEGLDVDGIR